MAELRTAPTVESGMNQSHWSVPNLVGLFSYLGDDGRYVPNLVKASSSWLRSCPNLKGSVQVSILLSIIYYLSSFSRNWTTVASPVPPCWIMVRSVLTPFSNNRLASNVVGWSSFNCSCTG